MEQEQIVRRDFPLADGEAGFDRSSVGAHLVAVAAHVAALESMITALEVEREALRRRLGTASPEEEHPTGSHPVPFTRTGPPPAPGARLKVFPENGHRTAARFGTTAPGPKSPATAPPAPAVPGEAPLTPDDLPPAPGQPAGSRQDEVSARLTASTLALDGADRETIRARLEAEYSLGDTDALLDDVLARLA